MSTDSVEDGPISAPMVAALGSTWAAIHTRHPQLPTVVLVLGAGSIGSRSLRLGHFAATRWRAADHDPQPAATAPSPTAGEDRLPEVFIGGEGLARGAVAVLGTLLHEAAHALAHVRGIKDTSRQGRWHNARFRDLAEEVGINVEKDPRIGWSPTTVPAATRLAYTLQITELEQALRLHRATEPRDARPTKPPPPACVCGCGRRIRVAPTVLAAGPILCGVCASEFRPADTPSRASAAG